MSNETSKFIENLLLEAALDSRIEEGAIDLTNVDHLDVVCELLKQSGLTDESVDILLESLSVQEGKHPDRQAYNKEGWLVTFPSKQYRDAALKKGTHSLGDPTHGKGGMNLYYKKRGKQKRMTQQQPSVAGAPQAAQPTPPAPAPQPATAAPVAQQTATTPQTPAADQGSELPTSSGEEPKTSAPEPKEEPQAPEQATATPPPSGDDSAPQQKSVEPVATAPETSAPPAEPNKVEITEKFASSKGWEATQYGEWRNGEGETVAVVSLSGEVTPIKSNDREELKLFASKQS